MIVKKKMRSLAIYCGEIFQARHVFCVLLALTTPVLFGADTSMKGGIEQGKRVVYDDFNRFGSSAEKELSIMTDGVHTWTKRVPKDKGFIISGGGGRIRVGYHSGRENAPHDTGVYVTDFTIANAVIHLFVGGSHMKKRPHSASVGYRGHTGDAAAGAQQKHAYHVELKNDWSAKKDLILCYGKEVLAFADIEVKHDPKAEFQLLIAFAGNRHQVWVDGKRVIDYQETKEGRSLPGYIGFGGFYTIGTFDDFAVFEARQTTSDSNAQAIPKCFAPKLKERVDGMDNKLGLHSDGGGWRFYPATTLDRKLPNVLLIGDSIMNGYRSQVIKRLEGKANVDCWLTPVHLKSKGLHEDLKKVSSYRKYDVIHFNIGLHGWDKKQIINEEYPILLKEYVTILKQQAPTAKLIWGSTTQVHEKGKPVLNKKNNPTVVQRNEMASAVMKDEGIAVNDLYGMMSDKLDMVRGDQYHWKPPAYEIMAKQVVKTINDKLNKHKK